MNYDVIPISFSGPSHCLPVSLSWPNKDYLYLSTMHAVTCLSSLHQNVKNHSSWIISTNPCSKWKSTKLYSPKSAWVLHPPPNVHLTSAIVDVKIEKLEQPRVVVKPAQWEWHDVWYKTELYNQVRSKWGESLHHCTCTHKRTSNTSTLLLPFCLLRVDLPVFSAADWPDECKRGPASVDHPTSDGHTSGCKFWRFNVRLEEKIHTKSEKIFNSWTS